MTRRAPPLEIISRHTTTEPSVHRPTRRWAGLVYLLSLCSLFSACRTLPDVELGHLSRAVDEVMRKAILEGAKLPLAEGLRLEAKCFGEVVALEDMKIGIANFLKNGPRAKASFQNR